jgi:hypothetical protein
MATDVATTERRAGWFGSGANPGWGQLGERTSCGRVSCRPVTPASMRSAGRAVPAVSLPRLAARAAALEVAAPHRTPRPGEGRAPTTAG